MKFFGNKEDELFLQFPDGKAAGNQSDIDRMFKEFTLTPTTMGNYVIPKPDIQAWASASAKLFSLGLNDEPFFACGPVRLFHFPKEHNEYIAGAILTPNYLIVSFQKGILQTDYLILPLMNFSGLTSTGPWSANFNCMNGMHRDKNGLFEMAETYFGLSERLGKDGQANRRSVTLMKSLSMTLSELHSK